jgi:predicted transcriptional regulator
MTKHQVVDSLKNFPENFSIEDLIERLIFIEKVEEGLAQSKNGETVSMEDAKKRLHKWLQ